MTNEASTKTLVAHRHEHIQCILLAGIKVIQPCGYEPSTAELATVLVWDCVVRIVVPQPVIRVRSNRFAIEPLGRDHPDETVTTRGARKNAVQRLSVEGPRDTRVVSYGESRLQTEQRRPKVDDGVTRRKVADCMVDACCNRRGTSRALRFCCEIRLEHELAETRYVHAKAGVGSVVFALVDHPRAIRCVRIELRRFARARGHGFRAQGDRPQSIREPAGVRYFVERVHVHGATRWIDSEDARDGIKEGLVGRVPGKWRFVLLGLRGEGTFVIVLQQWRLERKAGGFAAARKHQDHPNGERKPAMNWTGRWSEDAA